MTGDLPSREVFLAKLTPAEEHFLKKRLLENRLANELHLLSSPECFQLFGEPFKSNTKLSKNYKFPLLRFFFDHFIRTFPFLAYHSPEVQEEFWQGKIQTFVENFNKKGISGSEERLQKSTKRKQINKKVLSTLLFFFNSFYITKNDKKYHSEQHIRPTEISVARKLQTSDSASLTRPHVSVDQSLHEFSPGSFINDIYLNIVSVLQLESKKSNKSYFPSSIFSTGGKTGQNSGRNDGSFNKGTDQYVIHVVVRTLIADNKYNYSSYFIRKSYEQLSVFDKSIRHHFPGLLHSFGRLPKRIPHDEGIEALVTERKIDADTELIYDEGSTESFKTARCTIPKSKDIHIEREEAIIMRREKMRLALRGYLNSLLRCKEIVVSNIFDDFIGSNSNEVYNELSKSEKEDYEARLIHEKNMYNTQVQFQIQVSNVILDLGKSFDNFKDELISNPSALSSLFQEIGKTSNIQNLSPIIINFIEWCKLQMSATIYQLFVASDYSCEWFRKCYKFHRLFPYNLVYGILRFSNPVKIISKLLDLLLVDIPTFSMPSIPWIMTKHADKKKGSKNLLSWIFIMLLDEDMNDYSQELASLKKRILRMDAKFGILLNKIDNYVNSISPFESDNINVRAKEEGKDLLLYVLSSDDVKPKLDEAIRYLFDMIHDSYDRLNGDLSTQSVDSEVYILFKQYWQLTIRKRDKALMKMLWQEPEMTLLIKEFMIIFYQPIMRVLAKADMHVAFKAFKEFMDDLMKTISEINDGQMYTLSPSEMFLKINSILDRHQDQFWEFFHSIYKNDDQEIFINLAKWIEKFLYALRLKFSDPQKVTLDLDKILGSGGDFDTIHNQLLTYVRCVLKRRQIIKGYLQEKSDTEDAAASQSDSQKINHEWGKMANEIFGGLAADDFGVDEEEINDLNLLHDLENLKSFTEKEKNLNGILNSLELITLRSTSEVDKYDDKFRNYLNSVSRDIDL